MQSWDIFHAETLDLKRGLTTQAIREAFSRGALGDDDLVRPAATTVGWRRLAEIPELIAASSQTPVDALPVQSSVPIVSAHSLPPGAAASDFELQADDGGELPSAADPTLRSAGWLKELSESGDVSFPVIQDLPPEPAYRVAPAAAAAPARDWDETSEADAGRDDEADGEVEVLDAILEDEEERDLELPAGPIGEPEAASPSSRVALPVVVARGWDDTRSGSEGEEEEEADLSLSRSGPQTVEELDMAPMVDVAFQLVLFFMVTATTVLFKTLEIPKPSNEAPPSAVVQGRSRSLDDLKEDYILVEVDAAGAIKIDREPVAADMHVLVERLRQARERTQRKAMLLSADYATKHRSSVLAYDAANEIGLGIVIARPQPPAGPPPALVPSAPAQTDRRATRPAATPAAIGPN